MAAKRARSRKLHPADQYIQDVLDGKVVACKWVKLACQRHLNDLEQGAARGLVFDQEAGQRAIDFFQFVRHSKGEWAGQTLVLEPWQVFIIYTLFGWKREDGTRRFRTAYLEVARKNGKSSVLSAVGLYLLDADREPGAEVFSAATKKEQAKITYDEATRMVKSSPGLRKRLKVLRDRIVVPGTAAKFEPLGRDSDSLDGLNIHGAIVDELHAHKTRDMWDVLETGMGARRQPLMMAITTAGYSRQTICYEMRELVTKVLEGTVENDSLFGIVYTLDEGDDWQNEKVWIKANPNLGVSVKLNDLREQARTAKQVPSALNAFLRLRLNVWTTSSSRWLDQDKWSACNAPVDSEGLRGRVCFGGLDLSSSTDITAFVLVFPPEVSGDPYRVMLRCWIPEENMHKRSRDDGVPYESWVRQGWMKTTPGNVVDYDFIIEEVLELADQFDIREIGFDDWNATATSNKLMAAGLEMVKVRQGFITLSPAMKQLEVLVLRGEIAHGGNVPLTWMVSNVVAEQDAAGNIKPSKAKSTERIDGVAALLNALSRALLYNASEASSLDEIYKERGVLAI